MKRDYDVEETHKLATAAHDQMAGRIYEHYKGAKYRVLSVAVAEKSGDLIVTYEDAEPPKRRWSRSLFDFTEIVDDRLRFRPTEESAYRGDVLPVVESLVKGLRTLPVWETLPKMPQQKPVSWFGRWLCKIDWHDDVMLREIGPRMPAQVSNNYGDAWNVTMTIYRKRCERCRRLTDRKEEVVC